MRREIRAGRPSRRSAAPPLPFEPEDPAQCLRKFGPLHAAILESLTAAEQVGATATPAKLVRRLCAQGHATSEYEVRGKINELRMLGLVRSLPNDVLERDSPVPVLGVIS